MSKLPVAILGAKGVGRVKVGALEKAGVTTRAALVEFLSRGKGLPGIKPGSVVWRDLAYAAGRDAGWDTEIRPPLVLCSCIELVARAKDGCSECHGSGRVQGVAERGWTEERRMRGARLLDAMANFELGRQALDEAVRRLNEGSEDP